MRKYLFWFLIVSAEFASLRAERRNSAIIIAGQVTSDLDSVKLLIAFSPYYISGGRFESQWFDLPVDKEGRFYFSYPAIEHIGRIYIVDRVSTDVLCTQEQQIVEPGDSVFFKGTIHDKEEPYFFRGEFFGKGKAKYECIQSLKLIDDSKINDDTLSLPARLKMWDSLFNRKIKILNSYKDQLSEDSYQIIKSDITGHMANDIFRLYSSLFYNKFSRLEMTNKKIEFDSLIHYINPTVPDDMLAMSSEYIKYLYEKEKIALAFAHFGYTFTLKHLFEKIRNEYQGKLREKLLAYCLTNDEDIYGIFSGTASAEYTDCLMDAIAIIKTAWLKHVIENRLVTRGKGAQALNFTLPVDSSNAVLSLSDLKGKVLLLDMWPYACTGCTLFAQAFHERVYPQFKSNSNFSVVSIMLGEGSKEAYMRRLRREGGAVYTYPNNINLFGGKGEEMGRTIEKYYNINTFPFILLVDKDGKIFSSTIPFFTDPNSPNVDKMVNLIKDALQKK